MTFCCRFLEGRQVLEAAREEQPGGEAVARDEAREGERARHARAVPRARAPQPLVSNRTQLRVILFPFLSKCNGEFDSKNIGILEQDFFVSRFLTLMYVNS